MIGLPERWLSVARWSRYVFEAAILAFLTRGLVRRLISHGPNGEPNIDQYASYARYLIDFGGLPEAHPRLPGYPAFMWLSYQALGRFTGGDVEAATYWVQIGLAAAFILALYLGVRRLFGIGPAVVFLLMMSWYNFFTRTATAVMSDFLYAVLWLPVSLLLFRFLARGMLRPRALAEALGLFIGAVALYAVRSITLPLLLLFVCTTVIVRLWPAWRGGTSSQTLRPVILPTAAAILIILSASLAADALWDRGARAHHALYPKAKVVALLPPASETPDERRIEEIKAGILASERQPLEMQKFYLRSQFRTEPGPVEAEWLNRLRAYPLTYLAGLASEVLLNGHMLARELLPFFGDTLAYARYPDFPRYGVLNPSSEVRKAIFRASGLVLDRPYPIPLAIANSLLEIVMAFGLIAIGLRRIVHDPRLGLYFQAVVLSIPPFVVLLTVAHSVEGRYLLFYFPLLHIAQAVAIADLFAVVWKRVRARVPSGHLRLGTTTAPSPLRTL